MCVGERGGRAGAPNLNRKRLCQPPRYFSKRTKCTLRHFDAHEACAYTCTSASTREFIDTNMNPLRKGAGHRCASQSTVRHSWVVVLPEGQGAVADLCLGQVREQGHLLGAGKVGLGSCPARLLLPCPPSLLFPPGRACVSVHGAQRGATGTQRDFRFSDSFFT